MQRCEDLCAISSGRCQTLITQFVVQQACYNEHLVCCPGLWGMLLRQWRISCHAY